MRNLGESIIREIEKQTLPLLEFTVGEVAQNYPKEGCLSFKPSDSSESRLKELNGIVNKAVCRLGYKCNRYTQTNHYTPHMSIISPPQPVENQDFINLYNGIINIEKSMKK